MKARLFLFAKKFDAATDKIEYDCLNTYPLLKELPMPRNFRGSLAAVTLALLATSSARAQEGKDAPTFMNLRGKILLQEDLQKAFQKGWAGGKGKWEFVDGAVRGSELAADKHGAVKRLPLDFHDAVIQYDFKLDGAKTTTFSINGKGGHICRVLINAGGFSIRKDLAKKIPGDAAKVVDACKTPISPGRWHTLTIEIKASEMLASVDGQHFALGSHDGINVPFTNIGLTVAGESASFKNLRIWSATANPKWPATRAKLIEKGKKS